MGIYSLGRLAPTIDPSVYIAPSATVIGQVTIERQASVWPGVVIRADNESIFVGEATNVQDQVVLHADAGFPTRIGEGVSIGHGAILHGCSIGARTLVGIGAVILNGAEIGEVSLVAAGALIGEGKQFPPRSLLLGIPAKQVRDLTDAKVAGIGKNRDEYVSRAQTYRDTLSRRCEIKAY